MNDNEMKNNNIVINDLNRNDDDDLFIDGLVLSVLICVKHKNRTNI